MYNAVYRDTYEYAIPSYKLLPLCITIICYGFFKFALCFKVMLPWFIIMIFFFHFLSGKPLFYTEEMILYMESW